MSTIVTNFYSTVILHHVVGFARETPNGICREEEIYGKELAHTIREVEKSLNLPSARWRPRKAGGVIQPKSERLRSRSTLERRSMSQLKQSSRKGQILPSAFCSSQGLREL